VHDVKGEVLQSSDLQPTGASSAC